MAAVPPEVRSANATKASLAALGRIDTLHAGRILKYGAVWKTVYARMAGAKRRCSNTRNIGWKDYGGRGIEFKFCTPFEAAFWVLDNLGPPPAGTSIDRIDNNGNYEPGNLRWATRAEQNQNKRAYRRSEIGLRVRNLKQQRPDLTDQTIREWVKQGRTDDEITNRRKHIGCGVRHSQLRSEK